MCVVAAMTRRGDVMKGVHKMRRDDGVEAARKRAQQRVEARRAYWVKHRGVLLPRFAMMRDEARAKRDRGNRGKAGRVRL